MYISIIFALAFFVRIYMLGYFFLNIDEPIWLTPLKFWNKFLGIPVALDVAAIQPFFSYLVFFTRKIFPSLEFAVRVPSVIIGSLTVISVYLLAKEMYGKKAGLAASLFLSLLPWHIIQSRIGVSVILTPFFGCLIFLCLIKAINKHNDTWFLLSCFFAAFGSFYTYQASVLFTPIFALILVILAKELYWIKPKTILLSVLIFLLVIYPLIYLQSTREIDFLSNFYRPYQQNVFIGNIFSNFSSNFSWNIPKVLRSLFFYSGDILFAKSFKFPLLISWIVLPIIIFSIIHSLWRRSISDKIVLSWLGFGLLGSCGGINFTPHYIMIILPALLILAGKFIACILYYRPNKIFFKVSFFTGILLCALLVYIEVFQLFNYYQKIPFQSEEYRQNCYGCREALNYLTRIPDRENHDVVVGKDLLGINAHLWFLNPALVSPEIDSIHKNITYYVFSNPFESPSKEDKKRLTQIFLFWEEYPEIVPIKVIYFPNKIPAIYIYKVENNEK